MFDPVRSALALVFEWVRDVDESFARGGIANAASAVRANEHRNRLVVAARSPVTEDLRLPTGA